jgi:L-fuculose-phosphate aldolase
MNFDQACREIVRICLDLAGKGYLAGTGGNVACRIDDEHYAVTPSATDYYKMTPEDICVLRLRDHTCVAGERRPSVEHRLHANIFRTRRDWRASIHTHQPVASAYTLLGRALKISDPRHRALLGPEAALVDYAPSGTNWLASKLQRALRPEINAYLLRNHGVVCCGGSLDVTVAAVEALEKACADYFHEALQNRGHAHRHVPVSDVLTLLSDTNGMEASQ